MTEFKYVLTPEEFNRILDGVRAEERERILAPHKEIDADNSCGDPDCCGGPYPYMVCELCGVDWPCPTVAAARGEDTK